MPPPMPLHFMDTHPPPPLDTDPRAWRFTLGDTDFF
jgi:hypothetical protein